MTTIITRLYNDDTAANAVVSGLFEAGFPDSTYDVIGEGADAVAAMTGAQVSEESATAYAAAMNGGKKLVVIRAPFAPFGAAKEAIKIADSQPSVDAGVGNQNALVSQELTGQLVQRIQSNQRYGDFLYPLISRRKPHGLTHFKGTKHFGAFLTPLINNRRASWFPVYHGTKRFGDFLFPLISRRKPWGLTVYSGTKRFGDFLFPLLIKR